MAQLGVAGAGAAVGGVAGFLIGGPAGIYTGAQIGWALGGVAGALLFPTKGPNQEGPRLGDLSVQTSGYGVPIPVVAARAKLAGNVIWCTEIEERKTTRRQGKGGGGPRTVEYTYSLSWAVGLCEWLIPPTNPGVLRIWLNDKLVYDVTGESEVVAIPGLSWRFYGGSETQFPDPLLEAKLGAGNAPAHRGLAYIVFEAVPLTEFGNRMPQATVEIAAEITRTFPQVAAIAPTTPLFASDESVRHYNPALTSNVAVDYARGRIYEGRSRTTGATGTVADELIRVCDLVTMQAVGEYRYDRVLAPIVPLSGSVTLNGHSPAVLHVGADGFLYAAGGTSTHVPIVKIDPDRMAAVDLFGGLDGEVPNLSSSLGAYVTVPIAITSLQCPRLGATPVTYLACVGNFGAPVILNADRMEYVWGDTGIAIDPPPFSGVGAVANDSNVKLVPGLITQTGTDLWVVRASLAVGAPTVQVSRLRITSGAADLGGGASMGITRTDYADVDVVADVDASASQCYLLGALWDETDDTLIITIAGNGPRGSYNRVSTFKWVQGAGPIWALVNHAGSGADDARGDAGRLLSGLWGRGGNLVLQPGSGDAIVNASGATWAQTLAWLDEQQAVVGWSSGRTLVKRYLTRAAPVDLTVGDVVAALSERAGLSLTDIDTAALTDSLRGYVLARPMSARDAMTPLLAYANADAVEQDDVILFRKRAGSTVAALPYEDLVREEPDASVIEEQRAQDNDLPRKVTVRFPDIERGWEQGAQSWQRPISPTAVVESRGDAAVDLPIPLTVNEARTFARRQTVALWRERTRVAFSVGPKYARLVPTDPITVATRDGATVRCRVLSTQLGANWITRIEAVTEDAASYALTAVGDGGGGWIKPEMPLPYYVRLALPDMALVEDADDLGQAGLREYAFALAFDGTRFRGVQIVRSRDGSAWDALDVVTTPSTWGSLVAAPVAPATPWTWDEVNTLSVRLSDGDLDSATSLEVLNGANRAALVGGDGSAEIVQFRTATLEADGSYTLTGLLRGRRGTEDLIATRRAGDAFILLDATQLPFTGELGSQAATRYHRALTVFDTVDTPRTTTVKNSRGRAERPYAVAHLTGTRDGSQNLALSWVRRTRAGGEWVDGTGTVPLSEATEAYEVDVISGPMTGGATCNFPALLDGDPATIIASTSDPLTVEITFGLDQRIGAYGLNIGGPFVAKRGPTAWTFEAWDGAAWVVVDTRTGQSWAADLTTNDYTLALPATSTRFRWVFTAFTGGTFTVLGAALLYRTLGGPDLAVATYAQTVKRTLTSTTQTVTYSAAQQTTDFGATQPEVLVRVHQMSALVGRGVVKEAWI
jgi:hypothetical protein